MRRAFVLSGCAFLMAVLFPAAALAQPDVDFSRLEKYFTESLKSGRNAKTYEPLIAQERARIRSLLESGIAALAQPEGGENKELEPAKALDRQRQIISDLTGRLNESTVDLNLLRDEEKIYRGEGTGGSGVFMMTKSEPELLARKVVLEEESSLLGSALTAQQTRLQKLLLEQRTANLALFLSILWYLAIVFAVVWTEHFLRTQIFLRIPHRMVRYALSKAFTTAVYLALLFWIFQRIYAEYPGLTTVFAVVGAALIFMLQDIIKSFLGWLTYKGALKLGDRVTLGDVTGDVLDIGVLHTTLLASRATGMKDVSQAGKIVRVPNVQLLIGNLVNYRSTSDFENVEIPLFLADPAQGERAMKVLEDVLAQEVGAFTAEAMRQMDRRMRGFFFSQVSPSHRVYLEMTEKREMMLVLCFPAPIGQRRQVITTVLQRVMARFGEEGIGLAKPA